MVCDEFHAGCHSCQPDGGDNCQCREGYVLSESTQNSCIEASGSTHVILIATIGSTAALIVLIGIVILVVVLVRRREREREETETTPKIIYENDYDTITDTIAETDCVYDTIDSRYIHRASKDTAVTDDPYVCTEDALRTIRMPLQDKINSEYIPIKNLKRFVQDLRSGQLTLKDDFECIPLSREHASYANNPELMNQQRFPTIIPYDENRVILSKVGSSPLSDYINASRVPGPYDRRFIAAQSPLNRTVNAFWRMIWEQKVHCIVMLSKLSEKNKDVSEKYWPDTEGTYKSYGNIHVKITGETHWMDFIERKIIATKGNEMLYITQFQLMTWPEEGVPPHAIAILKLLSKVLQSSKDVLSSLLVHCSSGAGRTGTFIALHHLIEKLQKSAGINVFDCVLSLRQSRMLMVQFLEQYHFLHQAVLEALTLGTAGISFPNATISRTAQHSHASYLQEQLELLEEFHPPLSPEQTSTARLPENLPLNRSSILPANSHIAPLLTDFEGRNKYINAIRVSGFKSRSSYIVTQWPLEDTLVDFWRLVLDYRVKNVFLLEQASGNSGFPNIFPSHSLKYGRIAVKWDRVHPIPGENGFVFCNVHIQHQLNDTHPLQFDEHKAKLHTIGDLQYTPLDTVIAMQRIIEESDSVALLVCSDGASCCGWYTAAFNTMENYDKENALDVFYMVHQVKSIRPEFVAEKDQLHKLHKFAKEYVKSAKKAKLENTDTYNGTTMGTTSSSGIGSSVASIRSIDEVF